MHEKCLIWTTGRVCKHGGLGVGGKIKRKGFCPSTQIEILWHRWNAWKVFALNNWTELNWSGLRRQLSKHDHTESWIIGETLAQQTSSGECHYLKTPTGLDPENRKHSLLPENPYRPGSGKGGKVTTVKMRRSRAKVCISQCIWTTDWL